LYLATLYPSFSSYPDPNEKEQFHRDARKLFKETAKLLDKQSLKAIDIHVNRAGPSVSGEILMYLVPKEADTTESISLGVFCEISSSCIWGNPREDHLIIMARSHKIHIKDGRAFQEGLGGLNCFASPKANIDPKCLADWLYSIYFHKIPMPTTHQTYVPHIESLGGQIPFQKSLF
jgi:hypothetical protein